MSKEEIKIKTNVKLITRSRPLVFRILKIGFENRLSKITALIALNNLTKRASLKIESNGIIAIRSKGFFLIKAILSLFKIIRVIKSMTKMIHTILSIY